MKYYGIFDSNKNYTLLRYSEMPQTDSVYTTIDDITRQPVIVSEVCLSDIDYSIDNIGKSYNPSTKQFN